MQDERIAAQGLVLLGCGKMGSAMLAGWLDRGLPPAKVWVLDPAPSDWLEGTGQVYDLDTNIFVLIRLFDTGISSPVIGVVLSANTFNEHRQSRQQTDRIKIHNFSSF